jgi:hypothetical protein
MKATLRIPTKEQYAYIEVECEGTEEEIKEKYDSLTRTVHGGEDHNSFYNYLIALADSNLAEWGNADNYASLSEKQKAVVQAIKRFSKRIK